MKNITNIVIEFPCVGKTYARNEYGVYEYGVYPRSSVLAGQSRRVFLDSFESLSAARAAYPRATEIISESLPDESWDSWE